VKRDYFCWYLPIGLRRKWLDVDLRDCIFWAFLLSTVAHSETFLLHLLLLPHRMKEVKFFEWPFAGGGCVLGSVVYRWALWTLNPAIRIQSRQGIAFLFCWRTFYFKFSESGSLNTEEISANSTAITLQTMQRMTLLASLHQPQRTFPQEYKALRGTEATVGRGPPSCVVSFTYSSVPI